MICWIFAAISMGAALAAAVVGSMKRATLALWIAGLGMGAVYLTLGAETLAIIQWIVSTLVAISLFFFSVMFGEYDRLTPAFDRSKVLKLSVAAFLGLAFAGVIYLGSGDLTSEMLSIPKQGNDLASVGKVMTESHLLSLEVLALTLFLVLVGGGVIARPEASPDDQKGEPTC